MRWFEMLGQVSIPGRLWTILHVSRRALPRSIEPRSGSYGGACRQGGSGLAQVGRMATWFVREFLAPTGALRWPVYDTARVSSLGRGHPNNFSLRA